MKHRLHGRCVDVEQLEKHHQTCGQDRFRVPEQAIAIEYAVAQITAMVAD